MNRSHSTPISRKVKSNVAKKRSVANTAIERDSEPILRMPELPKEAQLDPKLGKGACPWLDDYIAFSRKWSPRAYDGFHEACALWLLSTIAARRIGIHYGSLRYTNLYILLIARTSIYAKSTTANIAIQALKDIGLSHLLVPDNATPERFISIMAESSVEVDEETISTHPAGQRGWFYEEFGQHVAAMMKPAGAMSAFLSMLKRLDDCRDKYTYSTISRKDETIENPYLALLANMTPDCIKPFSKRGSTLWGDGFLARFALICPPEEEKRSKAPFPRGIRKIPSSISEPLQKWNEHLGIDLSEFNMTKQVRTALEAYNEALLDLIERSTDHDLDGSYAKLHEKTLRIALLLASVSGKDRVELKHWVRAQQITERWRAGLHELYYQVNSKGPSDYELLQEKLLNTVQKLDGCTAKEASKYIYGRSKT